MIESLDHLVGEREQVCWRFQSDCFGGLEVDHKVELGRSLNGQITGFGSFENLPCVDADLIERIRYARSIVHEAAGHRELAPRINRRHLVTGGESDELINVVSEQRIDTDLESLDPVALMSRKPLLVRSHFWLRPLAGAVPVR